MRTEVRIVPSTSMSPHSSLLSLIFLVAPLLSRPAFGFLPYTSTVSTQQPLLQHARSSASSSPGITHRSKSEVRMSSSKPSAADKLRGLISRPEILIMPCCYDGLTARLVEDNGFPLTFMTGFGVSGAHGLPDTQARGTFLSLHECSRVCNGRSSLCNG